MLMTLTAMMWVMRLFERHALSELRSGKPRRTPWTALDRIRVVNACGKLGKQCLF
jgi:hypothetical protein